MAGTAQDGVRLQQVAGGDRKTPHSHPLSLALSHSYCCLISRHTQNRERHKAHHYDILHHMMSTAHHYDVLHCMMSTILHYDILDSTNVPVLEDAQYMVTWSTAPLRGCEERYMYMCCG